jgi:SWI/SNF-related matrix-associated actin-dependent regulator 1 of chromatin subfamily A
MAAGVGLTLTAASQVLIVEADWSPSINWQAEDRCHRIGQKDSVSVYYTVIPNTLDAHVVRTMVRKAVVIQQTLD